MRARGNEIVSRGIWTARPATDFRACARRVKRTRESPGWGDYECADIYWTAKSCTSGLSPEAIMLPQVALFVPAELVILLSPAADSRETDGRRTFNVRLAHFSHNLQFATRDCRNDGDEGAVGGSGSFCIHHPCPVPG